MGEVVIPAGMVAWSGGDSAPADYADGAWMKRHGHIVRDGPPARWHHDPKRGNPDMDCIAYTPRADEQFAENAKSSLIDSDTFERVTAHVAAMAIVNADPVGALATLRAGGEADRLREALEKIAQHGTCRSSFQCQMIARAALAPAEGGEGL